MSFRYLLAAISVQEEPAGWLQVAACHTFRMDMTSPGYCPMFDPGKNKFELLPYRVGTHHVCVKDEEATARPGCT